MINFARYTREAEFHFLGPFKLFPEGVIFLRGFNGTQG
jgi:hypothetical protein